MHKKGAQIPSRGRRREFPTQRENGGPIESKSVPVPQTGAALLVKSLEAQGVQYVSATPGSKIDKVLDTLLDSKIQTIVCRHEQNAAVIASGIGRLTSKTGVALVTAGPG